MYSLKTITQPTVEPVTLELFKAHLRLDDDDSEDDTLTRYLRAARSHLEGLTRRAFMPQRLALSFDHFPYGSWRNEIRLPRPGCLAVESITYRDSIGNAQTMNSAAFSVNSDAEPARIIPAIGLAWPLTDWLHFGSVKITYIAGSYALPVTDDLSVTSTGGGSQVQLSASYAGGPITLISGSTAVDFTLSGSNILLISDPGMAGQEMTANYFGMNVPPHVETAILMLAAHWYRVREAVSDTLMKEVPMGVQSLIADEICYAGDFAH